VEIISNGPEIKIICGTEEEKRQIPKLLAHLKNSLAYGWGGVRATIQTVETKEGKTRKIFIRYWEDER